MWWSAEAGYYTVAMGVMKLFSIKIILKDKDMGLYVEDHMELYYDNKTAINLSNNPVFHGWTKHIELDCHFIREKIEVTYSAIYQNSRSNCSYVCQMIFY